MFGQSEQQSQKQKKEQIIGSFLSLYETTQKRHKIYRYSDIKPQQVDSINLKTLEAHIKLLQEFEYQQTQNHSDIKLQERIFCSFNHNRKAQFLCCNQYCAKQAIICGQLACICSSEHHKCIFTLIQPFIDRIFCKMSQPIPKQIHLYFQAKTVIYEYMIKRISQERQILMDWQQDIRNGSEKSLFLYGLNQGQNIFCPDPKVIYQQTIGQYHYKCGCFPLKIRRKHLKTGKKQIIHEICNKIHKKYSSMINYVDQKIDGLFYYKKCANLSLSQFLLVDFLKSKPGSYATNLQFESCGINKYLQETKIVTGSDIYLDRIQSKNPKKFNLQKFDINRLRKVWKNYSEKLFRLSIEGKAMKDIFIQIKKTENLQTHTVQELRKCIDKIVQGLNQGQQYLFTKPKKTIELKNIDPSQLKVQLQKFKGVICNEFYITNDRNLTAVNDIETIKELGGLRNIEKLQIKWCQQMQANVSIEILNAMPHLKYLALLNHSKKLSQNFMRKLCQFKQLKSFFINSVSLSQYYRSEMEVIQFITFSALQQYNLPQIEELLKLSKLPKLQNIQIILPQEMKSAQVLKHIKALKHITLGHKASNNSGVHGDVIRQLYQQRQLRTLSITGVRINSKQMNIIIINNPFLSCIIIMNYSTDSNQNINDSTVELMGNLIKLQTLCISRNKAITGKYLRKLDNLIMLELCDCSNGNKMEVKEALSSMQKLQHLNLRLNKWVNDYVIMSVRSCKQITYLNIQETQVTSQGFKHLEGLASLNILISGGGMNYWMSGNVLVKLTKHVKSITKLSVMRWLGLKDDELLQIGLNCQGITHLNIKGTRITPQTIFKMKHLKVLSNWHGASFTKKLEQIGIKIYK